MSDYISRSALISDIRAYAERKHCNGKIELANGILKSISRIKEAPTVDTERHGKWIWKRRHRGGFRIRNGVNKFGEKLSLQVDERYEIDEPYCSICGKWNESEFLNYCPNCGVKMDGKII